MTADQKTCPWLEYFPENGDRVETIRLEKEVFTIGRCDSADFQIDSTRVSREHAQFVRVDGQFQIRDLQSTNGTYVNGDRVEQADLSAGDVIVVADTEFVFVTDSASRLRRMATQQMGDSPTGSAGAPSSVGRRGGQDAVLALRVAHEQLRCGFTTVDLGWIVEMPSARPFAHFNRSENDYGVLPRRKSPLLQPPSHALVRLREAQRRATVDRCSALADCARIVVPIDAWEVSEIKSLIWHFEALASALPSEVRLFASVKASEAVDLTEVQEFCDNLRRMRLAAICCRDFVGSHAHVEQLADLRPELLFLADELTDQIADNAQRQIRLQSVVESCDGIEVRPVVSGQYDRVAIDFLLEVGVTLFEHSSASPAMRTDSSNARSSRRELAAAVRN